RRSSDLLGETQSTLDSAKETSIAVQSAIGSLDAFIARTTRKSGPVEDGAPVARAFDVREYGEAAARIGDAAKELSGALAIVERSEAQTQRLLDDVQRRGDRSVEKASTRLLVVGLLLIGAGALAALGVCWIVKRKRPILRAAGDRRLAA